MLAARYKMKNRNIAKWGVPPIPSVDLVTMSPYLFALFFGQVSPHILAGFG